MSFTPTHERALKLIEEFKNGPRMSDVRLKSSARISGAFPLPELNNPFTPFNKRPFDDTILNDNDSLLKKRRIDRPKTTDDVNISDEFNDSTVAASPWELRKIKGELIQTKAELSSLEARCNKLFNSKKEDLLLFEQEKLELQQTIDNNRQTIADYELKLKKMRKREQQLKDELDGKFKQNSQQISSLEEKNIGLTEENLDLKAKLSDLESKSAELTRDLNTSRTELSQTKEELKMTNERLTKLQAQITEMKLSARQHELDKAALLLAQRKIAELENEAKNYSETAALLNEQQSKLIKMSELERQLNHLKTENLSLRDAPNKILKLNEVVHDLKEKLSYLDETEKLLSTTKVELARAVNELNDYRALSRGIIGENAGHIELNSYVREMQQARLVAHGDIATLQAKLKTADENNIKLKTKCEQLITELQKVKHELESTSNSVRRLKKQHAFITWERDELRKLLDSVEKETTVACVDSKVENLQRLVDGYRQRLDILEKDHSVAGSSPMSADTAATLEGLRKKNAELMQKAEKLEYELEHRNLKGDFDTRNTKILHFKMNPTDEAIKEREDALEKAQSEVAVLREKIKILQDVQNTSQVANITQIASDNVKETHSKELDELREKVKSQEIQSQRLLEAFKATSKDFREAVYSLLGYNVSSVQNKQKLFKLTSMYSDGPDHHLLFQMSPEGRMELLETEMSKQLLDLVNVHLCRNDSMPMFLSAVTMKLFSNQTQSTIVLD